MMAAQYISMWRDSFGESGAGPVDLNVASNHTDSFRSYVGGRLSTTICSDDRGCWVPELRAFWVHEYADDNRDITNTFAAGGPSFTIAGQNLGRDFGQFGVGLSRQWGDRVRASLQYDLYVTPDAVAHGGMGQVQFSW
jgi:fibronectin-binding autotransporter adhesin